jgi:hypothetical protein
VSEQQYPYGIGSPIAFVDPATGKLVHVGYLKEWRAINNEYTLTTVASREELGIAE